MLLTDLPIECWEHFVPADKSMMMSIASMTVKKLMATGRPRLEIHLSFNARLEIAREGDAKRRVILQKLGALAGKYKIETLDLIQFGMTDQDFPQLAAVLQCSVGLKCLELAYNDIGLGVRSLPYIAGLTSLTTLNLAWCNNLIFWQVSIARILRNFPLLRYLSLEGNRIGGVTLEVETPPWCPALEYLCLRENHLKFHSLLCVKEVLRQCPGLQHLDMSCNEFRAAEMDVLVGMFEHSPRLAYINFDANDMQHDDMDVGLCLAHALSPLTELTEVNLGFNLLRGLLYLGPVLEKWKGLQYLNIGYMSIGPGGAKTLADLLEHFEQLKGLNAAGNGIGWRGTQSLACGLDRCRRLTGLNMSNNMMGWQGAEALSWILGKLPLKFLYLSSCDIGARGCEALGKVAFQHLDDLSITDNDINVRGVQAIARAVNDWPALKSLSLGGNFVGIEGMGAVSDMLANCQGLTSLDLARNNVRDKGVDKLKAGLRRCPTLKEVVLISNNITDEGATSLADALPLCTALTKLNLSNNDKIGRDGERALRSSIPLDSPLTIELMQRSWLKPAGGVAKWYVSCVS
jgi:Ran GTPase-activating protein (RanGAP) involved in mRNA processing and transport